MVQPVLPLEIAGDDADSRGTSTTTGDLDTSGALLRKRSRQPSRVTRFDAIDPGSAHVGIARFEWTIDGGSAGGNGWRCCWAREEQPAGLYAYLEVMLDENRLHEVVIEHFVISLKMLQAAAHRSGRSWGAQSRDANETIECIGGVRVLCARRGVPMVRQVPTRQRDAQAELTVPLVSRGEGSHAKSAELHGWWRILSRGPEPWKPGIGAWDDKTQW